MTDLYHEWNGLVFGYKAGDDERYPMTSADDIESLRYTDGLIGGSDGVDGSALSPLTAPAASWVTVVDIEPPPGSVDLDGDYQTQRDNLKAATIKSAVELPYDIHNTDATVVTRFARCTDRQIPYDEESVVRRHATAQLEFTTSDPFTYGPEDSEVLAVNTTYAWSSTGWADSERWKAVIAGPVTNPQLTCATYGATAVMRYVGSIPSGFNLVIISRPRYGLTKVVADARLAAVEDYLNAGEQAYRYMDNGAARPNVPPAWFKIGGGSQSIAYASTAGTGTCTFTWREAKP